jgi:P4 family phage/plasmid primase-like protien
MSLSPDASSPAEPKPIAERQAVIDAIHAEMFGSRNGNGKHTANESSQSTNRSAGNLDDTKRLSLARKAKNGARFKMLFDRGEWQLNFPSQSEADLALCQMLAFWTAKDSARIDSLFRQSGLMREKWNRDDYREPTIAKAIEQCGEVYRPHRKGKTQDGGKIVLAGEDWNAAVVASRINEPFARDEGGYVPRGEEHIATRVKQLVPGDEWSVHLANETTEYIRADAPHLWERPPLDRLNLLNGILDLRTRELRPHTVQYLSSVQLPVRFDASASCPAWHQQIAATFPDDSFDTAWEIVAWLMLPYTSAQKALLLLGPGGSGKSTFLSALSAFIGKRNVSALSLQKLESDRFAASRLVGKLVNICADLPSTHLETSSTFKAVTGGDSICGEYKFRDSFDFTPFARLIFSANQPPISADATDAFFQRWYVLPMTKVFRGTDGELSRDELDARLAAPAEQSGVLNRALDVLPSVLKRGLAVTESMRQAHAEFWRMTDPLAIWLNRRTMSNPHALAPCDALISLYNHDAQAAGQAGMTEMAFGAALRRHRPEVARKQRTVAGKVRWCYVGISLLATQYDEHSREEV